VLMVMAVDVFMDAQMKTLTAALLYCILYPTFGLWYVIAFAGDMVGIVAGWLEDMIERVHP